MQSQTLNRTILLTGATGILARHIAARLTADGYRLILTDRVSMDSIADELGGNVIDCLTCDLNSIEEVEALTRTLLEKHRVDILINNAAYQAQYPIEDLTPELLRLFNRINVEAPYQLARALGPAMAARGWGRIINLVSGQAWHPYPGFIGYVTSKMGLVGLTRALASEFANGGVTVNGVTPSATQTAENKDVLPETVWADVRSRQIIHRTAVPNDLIGPISFLISDDAQFITAQTIFADGGLVIL